MLIDLLKVLAHRNIELKVKRDNNGNFEIHLNKIAFSIPIEDLFMKDNEQIWDEYFEPAFTREKRRKW